MSLALINIYYYLTLINKINLHFDPALRPAESYFHRINPKLPKKRISHDIAAIFHRMSFCNLTLTSSYHLGTPLYRYGNCLNAESCIEAEFACRVWARNCCVFSAADKIRHVTLYKIHLSEHTGRTYWLRAFDRFSCALSCGH